MLHTDISSLICAFAFLFCTVFRLNLGILKHKNKVRISELFQSSWDFSLYIGFIKFGIGKEHGEVWIGLKTWDSIPALTLNDLETSVKLAALSKLKISGL